MAETNEYDAIFAALKHPVRRQILLLLEQKGEVSFTDIQNALGINDTGLMSYHLKELAPLVEQSARAHEVMISKVKHGKTRRLLMSIIPPLVEDGIIILQKVARSGDILLRDEMEKMIDEGLIEALAPSTLISHQESNAKAITFRLRHIMMPFRWNGAMYQFSVAYSLTTKLQNAKFSQRTSGLGNAEYFLLIRYTYLES